MYLVFFGRLPFGQVTCEVMRLWGRAACTRFIIDAASLCLSSNFELY